MDNDLNFPERFEFHSWYLQKYGKEYLYSYSEMYRKLTGREGEREKFSVQNIVDEWMGSPECKKKLMPNIR